MYVPFSGDNLTLVAQGRTRGVASQQTGVADGEGHQDQHRCAQDNVEAVESGVGHYPDHKDGRENHDRWDLVQE